MALTGSGNTWAAQIVLGIDQTGLSASEITALEDAWKNVCNTHVNHLTSNTVVSTTVTGVTGTGSPTGPFPIVSQPGTGVIT
jgi:hypothetical protein